MVHYADNMADTTEVACGGMVYQALNEGEDVTDKDENVDCPDCRKARGLPEKEAK